MHHHHHHHHHTTIIITIIIIIIIIIITIIITALPCSRKADLCFLFTYRKIYTFLIFGHSEPHCSYKGILIKKKACNIQFCIKSLQTLAILFVPIIFSFSQNRGMRKFSFLAAFLFVPTKIDFWSGWRFSQAANQNAGFVKVTIDKFSYPLLDQF